jgi:hypothetical protein
VVWEGLRLCSWCCRADYLATALPQTKHALPILITMAHTHSFLERPACASLPIAECFSDSPTSCGCQPTHLLPDGRRVVRQRLASRPGVGMGRLSEAAGRIVRRRVSVVTRPAAGCRTGCQARGLGFSGSVSQGVRPGDSGCQAVSAGVSGQGVWVVRHCQAGVPKPVWGAPRGGAHRRRKTCFRAKHSQKRGGRTEGGPDSYPTTV